MAGQCPLKAFILVRIQVPEQIKKWLKKAIFLFTPSQK